VCRREPAWPNLLNPQYLTYRSLDTYRSLNATNRYALAFRLHNTKTDAGRKKKIEKFVEMLKRGATIHPQNAPKRRRPSGVPIDTDR